MLGPLEGSQATPSKTLNGVRDNALPSTPSTSASPIIHPNPMTVVAVTHECVHAQEYRVVTRKPALEGQHVIDNSGGEIISVPQPLTKVPVEVDVLVPSSTTANVPAPVVENEPTVKEGSPSARVDLMSGQVQFNSVAL